MIRGYRKRSLLTHQLIAECVYAATFAMRDSKGKTVVDMFPQLFEDDNIAANPPLSDEEVKELQAEMDAINARILKNEAQP